MIRDCSECKHFDEFHTSRVCHDCKQWGASTDLIRRADAIEAVQDHFNDDGFKGYGDGQKMLDRINALLSVYAVNRIEALSEPQGDYISRAEALEQMAQAECGLYYEDCEADNCSCSYIHRILGIPSAKAVSREECDKCQINLIQSKMADKIDELKKQLADSVRWIPIEKGSPNNDEDVIVSVLDDHGDTPWKYTTVAWLCNGVWISDNEVLFGSVTAWMPLPKPYERDARTENKE